MDCYNMLSVLFDCLKLEGFLTTFRMLPRISVNNFPS